MTKARVVGLDDAGACDDYEGWAAEDGVAGFYLGCGHGIEVIGGGLRERLGC